MIKDQGADHSGEYRDSLTRLPQLANEIIQTNIRDEIQKLKDASAWQQPVGRSSETLVKYQNFRVVLVVMKQGSRMSGHHADGPISVHGLEGRIRLHMPDSHTAELGPGDILALERGVKHDVEAIGESAFLLTISWPTEPPLDRQEYPR